MTRWIYVDGADHTPLARVASLTFVEAAYGCDVGSGGFDRDDSALGMVPAMKPVVIEESAASPVRMFTGFVSTRHIDRGVLPKVSTQRQFDVALVDVNTLWDDPVLEGTDANRPEETDYARMAWLAATDEMTDLGISVGVMPNTNTVTLDARDYRGEHPRLVAEECMEAAMKNCFLYDYGSGIKIYYDLATGTSLSSSAKLSSVLADVNEAGAVFAVAIPALELDPDRVYSRVRFEYAGGHVTVDNGTTESSFRFRAVTIRDDTVKSLAKATVKANKYLTRSSTERPRFTTSFSCPAANVNDVRAGQRIQIKVPHLEVDGIALDAYVWMRIARRTVQLQQGRNGVVWDRYTITLEFADDLKPAGFGRSGPSGDTAGMADGASLGLTRYQLSEEVGSGYFGPAGGLWERIDPDFDFGSLAAPTKGVVKSRPEGNISWPYTDCGVGTGGVAGLDIAEAWFRFQVDLADDSVVGVRFTVAALTGVVGMADGTDTIICGVHTGADADGVELTAHGEWTQVGVIGDAGGEVFVPRSLLIDDGDGYCWFVLTPAWVISNTLFICNSAGAKPEGYAEAGTNAAPVVSAVKVTRSGSGMSPWLSGIGDVDGTNDTFELPGWTGKGAPQVRVGVVELAAGEYTWDGDALTVTLAHPPPADMAGQVAFRYGLA